MSVRVHIVTAKELDERFQRYFAAKQLRTDCMCCCAGTAVYLSLLRYLVPIQRWDLVALALFGAAMFNWPFVLSKWAKPFYLRWRDHLFLLHFIYQYPMSGSLARFVRLLNRGPPKQGAAFLATFALYSTVAWQAVDSVVFRMRFRRFVLFKLIIVLFALRMEWLHCSDSCEHQPEEAGHYFPAGAGTLRLVFAAFLPLPQLPLALDTTRTSAVVSCIKIQTFLMVMLSLVLPAMLLHSLEKQLLREFCQRQPLLAVSEEEVAAYQVCQQLAAAEASGSAAGPAAEGGRPSHAAASGSQQDWLTPDAALAQAGSRSVWQNAAAPTPPVLPVPSDAGGSAGGSTTNHSGTGAQERLSQLDAHYQRRWYKQQRDEDQAAALEFNAHGALSWRQLGLPLVLAAFVWHMVDALPFWN